MRTHTILICNTKRFCLFSPNYAPLLRHAPPLLIGRMRVSMRSLDVSQCSSQRLAGERRRLKREGPKESVDVLNDRAPRAKERDAGAEKTTFDTQNVTDITEDNLQYVHRNSR